MWKHLLASAALAVALSATSLSQQCGECAGDGGNDTAMSPGCGSIAISVLVNPGTCWWYIDTETGLIECKMKTKCYVSVTRSWNGVPPNTDVGHCVSSNGQTRCQHPPPNSGSGTGSSLNSWHVSCGENYDWSITLDCGSSGPQLSASVNGECNSCL